MGDIGDDDGGEFSRLSAGLVVVGFVEIEIEVEVAYGAAFASAVAPAARE